MLQWDASMRYKSVFTLQESGSVLHSLDHHTRHVGTCSFSRTGSYLATGSNDRSVAIWTIGSEPVQTGSDQFFVSCEESSKRSVTSKRGDATLCQTLSSHLSDVNSVTFVDDSDAFVSCSGDKTVRLWRRLEGKVN